jgi:hypothetical protein
MCFAEPFPDLGGVLDFSQPEKISNQLFILTNPKSGSHLLLYSIMKITKRPLRGRVPYWHFLNDPAFFLPGNIMGYPLDFTKPTMYWGHEYYILNSLNHSDNKLIFILRDYKETLISNLVLKRRHTPLLSKMTLEELLLYEITFNGDILQEFIKRLQLFDSWDPKNRCLVAFNDLTFHPETFVPQVMSFIEDDSPYLDFIDHYADFTSELMVKYRKKGNSTGSGATPKYFTKEIPKKSLIKVDNFMKQRYPVLWERYLKQFAEVTTF